MRDFIEIIDISGRAHLIDCNQISRIEPIINEPGMKIMFCSYYDYYSSDCEYHISIKEYEKLKTYILSKKTWKP